MCREAAWAAAVALFVLVACSPSDDPESTDDQQSSASTPSDPRTERGDTGLPPCEDIWQLGSQLPASYEGCEGADGLPALDKGYDCADGSKVSIYYPKPIRYAVTGQEIRRLKSGEFASYITEVCKPVAAR